MIDLLDRPLFFNFIRKIIAGKQEETKKFVSKHIKEYKCKKILDICCGTGDFAECVGQTNYLGIDISKKYTNYAKQKYQQDKNKSFLTLDLLKHQIPFDRKYDCALLISTLHHFSDQELNKILNEIQKSVKGKIIVADLDNNPQGFLRKIMLKLDRGKYIRSNNEKLLLLRKYFKIIKVESMKSRLAIQYGIICQN